MQNLKYLEKKDTTSNLVKEKSHTTVSWRNTSLSISLKAQVSIFIIVGLLILTLIVAGYILFNQTTINTTPSFVVQTVPQTPLEQYVQACMLIVTEDALLRLGEQGGYVAMPHAVRLNPSRSISVDPQRNYAVPYWTSGYESYIPTLTQMETQVGEYIDSQIEYCLGQFAGINEDVQVFSSPKTNVTFTDTNVYVRMQYELRAQNIDVATNFKEFILIYDAPIKPTIESAIAFAQEIAQTTYLSEMTINLMALSDPLVPMTNLKFTCEKPLWSKAQVTRDFEEILYYNVPKLRIRGAEFAPFQAPTRVYEQLQKIKPDDFLDGNVPYTNIPDDTYEYAHMYFPSAHAQQYTNSGVKVYARYLPEYGMTLDARPSRGDIMMGSTTKGTGQFLNFFCVHMYHFTYDVAYPIEFSFAKEKGLIDKPFILRFALPVKVQSNLPVSSNAQSFNLAEFDASEDATELCRDTHSEQMFITVRDKATGIDIPDATLTYTCAKYSCALGNTSLQAGRVQLVTQFPRGCFGAILEVERTGYLSEKKQVTSGTYNHDFELVPIMPIKYTVLLGPNRPGITPTLLKSGESAVVMIDDLYSDYTQTFGYDPSAVNALTLVRGVSEYNITVIVYDNSDIAAGYKGTLKIGPESIGREIVIYTKEYIPRPKGEELLTFWNDLEDPQIMQDYGISIR
jgi:hypothetical protein